MCITLNEINRDNVDSLTRVKYQYGEQEYICGVTYCRSYEELRGKLEKRTQDGDIHVSDFLVVNFHITSDEISQVCAYMKNPSLFKFIFTQENLQVELADSIRFNFFFCCSLVEELVGVFKKGLLTDAIGASGVCINFFHSAIKHIQLFKVNKLYCNGTTLDQLLLTTEQASHVEFLDSNLGRVTCSNASWNSTDSVLSFTNSECDVIKFYGPYEIGKIIFVNCKIKNKISILSENSVGELIMHHCLVSHDAELNFESALVADQFDLNLDMMPKTLLLPRVTGSTERSFDLAQSSKFYLASLVPADYSEEELCKLRSRYPLHNNMPEDDFRMLVQTDRLINNLERAHTIAELADRKRDSLDIIERILIEKRKRILWERKVEIDITTKSKSKRVVKQRLKYFEEAYLRNLILDWGVGYFINLKKVMRLFFIITAAFSAFFISSPHLLKIGTDVSGSDITLQQLPFIERVADSIYFTIVTLTTLGYGDMQPIGWGKLVAASLALIGLLLSGTILAVILRRYSR